MKSETRQQSGHQATVPPVARRYFEEHPHGPITEHPVVVAMWVQRAGRARWVRMAYRKRISPTWASKLIGAGVERVMLAAGGREAEFETRDLARRKQKKE